MPPRQADLLRVSLRDSLSRNKSAASTVSFVRQAARSKLVSSVANRKSSRKPSQLVHQSVRQSSRKPTSHLGRGTCLLPWPNDEPVELTPEAASVVWLLLFCLRTSQRAGPSGRLAVAHWNNAKTGQNKEGSVTQSSSVQQLELASRTTQSGRAAT